MQQLTVKVAQYSSAGIKPVNQDFIDACVPSDPYKMAKGAVFALSDGIGSSLVSQFASEQVVSEFIKNYYYSSLAWSIPYAARKVLATVNAQLYRRNMASPYQYNLEKGYVCTLSGLVLQGCHGHIFHVGDSRVYRLRNNTLEQLSADHYQWVNGEKLLTKAMGISPHLTVDHSAVDLQQGDIFILLSDGVFDFLDSQSISNIVAQAEVSFDSLAQRIADAAALTSDDNLSAQVIKVMAVPLQAAEQTSAHLPIPKVFQVGEYCDAFLIRQVLHCSNRSHVYVALDESSGQTVVLKAPSVDLQNNPQQLDRLLLEEWVANKVENPHLIKTVRATQPRHYCYTLSEYVSGQTLAQWLLDNPYPSLETVRTIIEQVAKGVGALHRANILHQDIRPENIMISEQGIVKVIDLGAARLVGFSDDDDSRMGTALYTAPEYFIGGAVTEQADLYSIAVLTYYMLSGRFPYGVKVAKASNIAAQNKLQYQSVTDPQRDIPVWLDATLKKALYVEPQHRYQLLSEFIYDLRHPNKHLLGDRALPWVEQNPLQFWRLLCLLLASLLILTWLAPLFH